MTPATQINGGVVLAPEETRLLEKLRQLPAEAVQHVDDFLRFLTAHYTNPGVSDSSSPERAARTFSSEKFLGVVKHLPPPEALFLEEMAVSMVGRSLQWNYDDPASLEVATGLMGLDPFLQRASAEISREFEVAVGDGKDTRL